MNLSSPAPEPHHLLAQPSGPLRAAREGGPGLPLWTSTSGLYAIPAIAGAAIVVTAARTGHYGVPAALGAAQAPAITRAAGLRRGAGDLPVLND